MVSLTDSNLSHLDIYLDMNPAKNRRRRGIYLNCIKTVTHHITSIIIFKRKMRPISKTLLILALTLVLVQSYGYRGNQDYGYQSYRSTYNYGYNPFVQTPEDICLAIGHCGNAIPFKSEAEFIKYLDEIPDPIYYFKTFDSQGPLESRAPTAAPSGDIAESTPDFSETNNQVENVDQADLIKTDGKFIYTISNGVVSIVRAFPYFDAGVVATIDVKGEFPTELFIEGHIMAVFGSKFEDGRSLTFVNIYSLYNPYRPTKIKTFEFEGYYIRGRKSGGYVYLISQFSAYFRDSELPFYRIDGREYKVDPSKVFYYPGKYERPSFASIFAFNLKSPYYPQPNIITMIIESTHTIFASESSIYLTHTDFTFFRQQSEQKTMIHKIIYDGIDMAPFADGEVSGSIINQFSMDQFDGIFRIATTSGFGDQASSGVYCLNSNMETIGSVDKIAPTERIFSTRFIKNTLYMVTFRQVDPFFVIDLTDHTNPQIIGQLKIPGFSRYLHPFDETTIIGLGRQADENGRVLGLKISLFDVSDLRNPREIATYEVEERYSSSIAEYQSRAFLFSREKELLVLPGYFNNFKSNDRFNGAFVFHVTKTSIELRGIVDHTDKDINNFYSYFVQRSLYIGDNLYTKSPCLIKINDIQSLRQLRAIQIDCEKERIRIISPPRPVPLPLPVEEIQELPETRPLRVDNPNI